MSRSLPRPGFGALGEQFLQTQVSPSRIFHLLRRLLDAEGGVLVWHHVIFILGVYWLVVGWDVNVVVGKFVPAKVLEQIRVPGAIKVNLCVKAVLVLPARLVRWARMMKIIAVYLGAYHVG